ncbi:putative zinc finger protein [Haloactinospora alba]|uniref:Putative zinc finger protein n=1 Tax=Haloactinospora alba TaxID=405555 RepID=A0A543NLN7_9ACTN|nr:zf-HC2 domain-containing protein [Haloactinospora alba]TQN32755.1 putative zinc finger protein [Haloactinospora alba]
MDHLGERLSALVDDEMGHAERDRALGHLASCEKCRFEADELRRLKRRLHVVDAPEPSTDFLGRLTAMGGPPSGECDPPDDDPPGRTSRPPTVPGERPGGPEAGDVSPATAVAEKDPSPTGAAAARRRHNRPLSVLRTRWRGTRYAAAGVSALAAVLGSAFIAGGEQQQAPVVRPALADYAAEHAVTAQQATVPDPLPYASTEAAPRQPVGERASGTASTSR